MLTQASASGNHSSLAEFRRRRGLEGGSAPPTPAPVLLQPRDRNIQGPIRGSNNEGKQSQNGEPPRAKKDMFADQESKGAQHLDVAAGNILRDLDGDPSMDKKQDNSSRRPAAEGKQSLKRTAQAASHTPPDPDSAYDIQGSPDEEDEYRPKKKATRSKAAVVSKRKAQSKTSADSLDSPKKKSGQKGKTKVDDTTTSTHAPDIHTGPSMSTRGRMKATSGKLDAAITARSSPAVHSSRKLPSKTRATESRIPNEEGEEASLSKEAASRPQSIVKTKNDPGAFQNGQEYPVKVKKERRDPNRDSTTAGGSLKQAVGTSQKEAIVLSDGVITSEDDASEDDTVPRRQTPKTPAVLPSSPPVANRASTQPTTARPAVATTTKTKKSTIIGFERSGPQNQGKATATSTRANGLQNDRSSLPPDPGSPVPVNNRSSLPPALSDARSLARVTARRSVVPPSAGGSIGSTRDYSPALSNVADNVNGALASFRRKSAHEQQAGQSQHTQAHRTVEPLHDEADNLGDDDSGFADIDNFGESNLLEDAKGQAAQQGTGGKPARFPHTASQLAMPPPAIKSVQKQAPPQASTIRYRYEQAAPASITQPAGKVQNDASKKRRVGDNDDAPTSKRTRTQEAPAPERQTETMDSSAEVVDVQRKRSSAHRQRKSNSEREGTNSQPGRQRSQGTVDVNGSPVPDGLVVGERDTALEVYSQQAKLSSDPVAVEQGTVRKLALSSSDDKPPISKPLTRLSSNTKALPAEPSQESQVITHVSRLQIEQESAAMPLQPPTNPFASADERAAHSTSSTFADRLRQIAPEREDGKILQSAIANDDPDKTLVEPSSPQQHRRKRIESFSSSSSIEVPSDDEDTMAANRDLDAWRAALQPHQANIFDSLVSISRRLVGHLVEQEQAVKDIIEDYRRRGAILVEQIELSHGQEEQKKVNALKDRKKRLQRELEDCGKQLAVHSASVKESRKEARRTAKASGESGSEGGLQDVLSTFC